MIGSARVARSREAQAHAAIVVAYIVLGVLYARFTPAWQAPDEPAHYNYVAYVAERGDLPVLAPGDWPNAYLEEIKSRRFPPDLSIAPLRYESHQPPLYYLWASLIYRFMAGLGRAGTLLGLRLLSVALGAVALWMGFQAVKALFPGSPYLAWGAMAFASALPMHLAMTAAVNNDVLVELLLALIAWFLAASASHWDMARAALAGALAGLALLTKLQCAPAVALVGASLAWDLLVAQRPRRWRAFVGYSAVALAIGALILGPWIGRNVSVYGLADPLALVRHDEVVAGQLTTRQYLAQVGWRAYIFSCVTTTFQSFWGQFGWMAAPLGPRPYQLLALVSAVLTLGLASEVSGLMKRWRCLPLIQRRSIVLIVVWLCVTVAGFAWYNARFVQFQGRYLFPALVPIGVALAAGLRGLSRLSSGVLSGALVTSLVVLGGVGLVRHDVPWFGTGAVLATSLTLLVARRLSKRWAASAVLVAWVGMMALSVYALFAVIVPSLSP